MKDQKLRDAIAAYGEDMEQELILLDNHDYDGSIVGITEDGRVVYDYEAMVEEYMNDESCPEEDAREWLDYNTLRAIPYMGEHAPVILNINKKDLLDRY